MTLLKSAQYGVFVLCLAGFSQLGAVTITVETNDPGTGQEQCSLRDAIRAADTDTAVGGCPAGTGADTLYLGSETYSLTEWEWERGSWGLNALALPLINSEISVEGSNAIIESTSDATTSSGSPIELFLVSNTGTLRASGLTLQNTSGTAIISDKGKVRLSNVKILNNDIAGISLRNGANLSMKNSFVSGGTGFGGIEEATGIDLQNGSSATITDSEIVDTGGAGIGCNQYVGNCNGDANTIVIENSTIRDMGAVGYCAVDAHNSFLTLARSTVTGHHSTHGSAVCCSDLKTTILDSRISSNGSVDGTAGGLRAGSQTIVLNSTISNNSVGMTDTNAGGVFAKAGAKIINSTISGNSGLGVGGIRAENGVEIINSTIVDNQATSSYSPIAAGISGDATLINTIVANNTGAADCVGSPGSESTHYLIGDGSCDAPLSGDPLLGPLADNGGPTQTHALMDGSPAMDAGDDAACQSTDQRGLSRPADGNNDGSAVCDIGSVEEQGLNPTCNAGSYELPHNQWRQIGLPCQPPNDANTVETVFADAGLGVYGTDWSLYRYDVSGNVRLNSGDSLSQGTGYWIIQINEENSSKTLKLPANSIPTPVTFSSGCIDSAEGCFDISLAANHEGTVQWNMVGYPFADPGPLSSVRILTNSGACSVGCDLDTAQSNGLVHNLLWSYNGEAYDSFDSSQEFSPWTAYWSATLDQASPKLLIPKPQ